MGWVLVVGSYLSLSGRRRGGRLLTFCAFRMGAYSRWVLIRGWALIQINTMYVFLKIRVVLALSPPRTVLLIC